MEDDVDKYLALHTEVDLVEVVGEGSYATVYKGLYKNKIVAVKVLRFAKEEEFINEVKQTKLQHPCILGLKAVVAEPAHEEDPSYYYIITQYAPDGSLAEFLKIEKCSWSWHLIIAYDIAQGLYFLHENNIIHRDLKSENVLLHQNKSHAMLCDFGLTITTNNTKSVLDKQCGTTKFMAPEILQGAVTELEKLYDSDDFNDFDAFDDQQKYPYSYASDMYAFGILMWELFHHQKPYHNHIISLELYKKIIHKNYRPTIQNNVPVACANLMMQCWDKNIENRPTAENAKNILLRLKAH
jgi:serine/threonine protein kinase